MAKDLRFSLLLAFYRNLLNDKQVEMLESYYDHDLSLSEISENVGMSRQGVRDTIKRAEQQLSEYEEKLGLMRRFREVEDGLDKIAGLAAQIAARSSDSNTAALAERIAALAGGLKE